MNWKRAFVLLLFPLGVGLTFSPAAAQAPAAPKLMLPCCKCLGERVQLNLHTDGTIPWTVSPGSGPTPTTLSAWTAAASPARWLQPTSPATSTAVQNLPANTTYHYQVAFAVPDNCTIPYEQVRLDGKWAADNQGAILLDSATLGTCAGPMCFNAPTNPLAFSALSVGAGGHALKVDVKNVSGYSGVLVNAVLTGRCTDKIHR